MHAKTASRSSSLSVYCRSPHHGRGPLVSCRGAQQPCGADVCPSCLWTGSEVSPPRRLAHGRPAGHSRPRPLPFRASSKPTQVQKRPTTRPHLAGGIRRHMAGVGSSSSSIGVSRPCMQIRSGARAHRPCQCQATGGGCGVGWRWR